MWKSMKSTALLAALALTASANPALAQHHNGAKTGYAAPSPRMQNAPSHWAALDWHRMKGEHHGEHRDHPVVPVVSLGVGASYWGNYGWNGGASDASVQESSSADGDTVHCDDVTHEPCWDHTNHASAIQRGSYIAGQPSAAIHDVAAQEGDANDRAWIERCDPRVIVDPDGISRYQYNGKRGCASGQWRD
jgi:hypothetical protein